jgi:glutamate receptor, ionotropic, plant
LQVDLSTAILSLSENGELERIHDKWLKTGDCTADNSEFVDSNQLRLESFWGMFLICGVACVLALLIYFGIMLRQFLRHEPPESAVSEPGLSKSRRSLKRFFSFVDDREPPKNKRTLSLSRSSMPTTPMSNLDAIDLERSVRPVRNASVTDIEN